MIKRVREKSKARVELNLANNLALLLFEPINRFGCSSISTSYSWSYIMDQVYLQEQPVEHHHSHHHSQHPHELVDPTLASVHLDPSSGEQAHDVYLDHGADVEEGHLVHNEVQQEGDGGEHDPSAYDAQALVEAHQLEQQLELDHHTGHHHHHGHHAHHLDPDSLVHGTLEDAGVGYHHMGEEEAGMDMDKPRVSHNRNPGGKNQYGSPG
jgi:hypothetical protein